MRRSFMKTAWRRSRLRMEIKGKGDIIMKNNYIRMELKIVSLDMCDVICTSGGTTEEPNPLFSGDNVVSDWN